jgi:hypothetical protein
MLQILNIESKSREDIDKITNMTAGVLESLDWKFTIQTTVIKYISPVSIACIGLFISVFIVFDLMSILLKKKKKKVLKIKKIDIRQKNVEFEMIDVRKRKLQALRNLNQKLKK